MTYAFIFTCRECRIKWIQNKRVCYAYKFADSPCDEVKSPGSFCPYGEGKPKWESYQTRKETK